MTPPQPVPGSPSAGPTKAVVLARGLGSRMRREDDAARVDGAQARVADTGVKAMIPIGRPFLDYALSALADAGFEEVCLVIGPEHDLVREHYASVPLTRLRVSFAVQEEPRGTADAVLAAESFAGTDRFLVLNSDNYYPARALAALRGAGGAALAGFDRGALVAGSNIGPERIRAYAVLRVGLDGHLQDVVEKPDAATLAALGEDAPVSMNAWLFTPAIFEACRRTTPSPRGELEITDAVRVAMHGLGEPFEVVPVRAGVLDLSSRGDIESVAERLAGVEVTL